MSISIGFAQRHPANTCCSVGAAETNALGAFFREDPDHDGLRPLQRIAEQTNGYSGSDLMELCKLAASIPIHEFMDEEMNSEYDKPPSRLACPALGAAHHSLECCSALMG